MVTRHQRTGGQAKAWICWLLVAGGFMHAARALRSARSWAAFTVLAWSLVAIPAARASQPASPAVTRYAQIRRVCPLPTPGRATCFALLRVPVAPGSRGARPYTLNDGASSSGPAGGLTPAQLASAYAYEPTAGGTGQTVAIVDAYNDPKIEEDLGTFDSNYGLAACTTANGCFKKVSQTGSTTSLPPDEPGWSGEISLDVEAVHGACPNCKILLVEANDEKNEDLAAAVNEAVSLGATEVSNSYGDPEQVEWGAAEQAAYNHPGVVIAASTGDDGYYDWDRLNEGYLLPQMPNAPASLPTVVAVGGTSLNLNLNGTRASETVWNDNGPDDEIGLSYRRALGATGGGCSTLFTAQPWQQGVSGFAATGCGNKRLDADISAVADPLTGFDIYDSYKSPGWQTIGGTSLSSPLVTSLYALAGGSGGVEYPAQTPYNHLGHGSSLYDVTKGGNGFCDAEALSLCNLLGEATSIFGRVDCEGTTACNAAPGFDGPSGVGTPNGLGAFVSSHTEEEEAKKKHEEEAAATKKHEEEAAVAKKHQEEEAAATAAKKHQEEEAAVNRKHEEEAAAKIKKENETAAQIATLLGRELTPSGKAAKIAALLKSGVFPISFKALQTGTAVINWYQVPPGAKLANKAKPKPVLVASGQRSFSAAGTATIKIKLTAAGKRLLKHAKQLKLTAKGTFTPTGKTPITATKVFVLKR
jgi:hypothetical protein